MDMMNEQYKHNSFKKKWTVKDRREKQKREVNYSSHEALC